jgi:glycosyltransferase involved in cell wall biosynthesis
MYSCLEKLASMFGGEVVASCASEADAFLKVGILSTTINNGICCSGAQGSRSDPGTLVIGTANRITAQKNPALFNEIARHFSGDAAYSFVWIGDGEMRDTITSPNIRKTGWVSMEKLDELLGSIDVYLSTALWEGLPLSALHAMCAGKPMILSNCTGHRDIVRSGVNGYLFENLDEAAAHIAKLKQDRELLAAMGQRSRDIVMKEFSVDKMIEQYRVLYEARAAL